MARNRCFRLVLDCLTQTLVLAHLVIKNAGTATATNYLVSLDISNSGAAVARVYIGATSTGVSRPPKELKGFVKVGLNPGETQRVTAPLDTRSFAYYDANSGAWRAPAGTYNLLVGKSSDPIELAGEIDLIRTATQNGRSPIFPEARCQ